MKAGDLRQKGINTRPVLTTNTIPLWTLHRFLKFDSNSDACPNLDSTVDREEVFRLPSTGEETLDDTARIFGVVQ